MESLVELAVSGAVESHPDPLAAGGRDGRRASEHGEGGVSWAAAGMGPGTQHDGRHDRADAAAGEQLWPPGPDQHGDGSGVVGDLSIDELDAASQGAQAGHGGGGLNIPGGPLPQPCAGADQACSGQAAKPVAEGIGSGLQPGRRRQVDKSSARHPSGSVIPRVTATATDRGPDHHRTEGSLTVIPPRPYCNQLHPTGRNLRPT